MHETRFADFERDEIKSPSHWDAPAPDASPERDTKLPALDIVTAASLGEDEPPRRRWHVQGLIPAGEITLLTGDGGTGKSLLALQLAFATAAGSDWIGTVPEAGRVIFVSAEDDLDELRRRLWTIAHRKGRRMSDAENLDLLSLAGKDALLAAPKARVLISAEN